MGREYIWRFFDELWHRVQECDGAKTLTENQKHVLLVLVMDEQKDGMLPQGMVFSDITMKLIFNDGYGELSDDDKQVLSWIIERAQHKHYQAEVSLRT